MMALRKIAATLLSIVALSFDVSPPALAQSPERGPTFEVVSVKRNTSTIGPGFRTGVTWRPDGSVTMTNVTVATMIARAYPDNVQVDMAGLPDWARRDRFDLSATSPLSQATAGDRIAMLRAVLADRFRLAVHMEPREHQVYLLQLARSDGRLGTGLKPVETDCARVAAERRAAAEAALEAGTPQSPPRPMDLTAPPPPCMLRIIDPMMRNARGDKQGQLGSLVEGETTMNDLASGLRMTLGRLVVNKTALAGSYRVQMNFDAASGRGGPALAPTDTAAPSIFTAVQEQLGLKLEGGREKLDTLVIDRLEPPSEN